MLVFRLMTPIIKLPPRQTLRINLLHRGKLIRFGTIDLKKDNSIVVAFSPLNDVSLYKDILVGSLNSPQKTIANTGDVHVTLHPKGQIAHMRLQSTGKDLQTKNIQWFPVVRQMHFLTIRTPSLLDCASTVKKAEVVPEVIASYEGSLEFLVYIVPCGNPELRTVHRDEQILLFGVKNNRYEVWVTYRFMNERVKPSVLWRDGSWFT